MEPSSYVLAGVLASLTVTSLAGATHALPRVSEDSIYLGVVGRAIVGVVVSVIWDNNPLHAFIASALVVGAVTMWEDIRNWRRRLGDNGREQQRQERLQMLRHKLRVAEQNLAYYGPGEAPVHLQVIIDELRREIAEEEGG